MNNQVIVQLSKLLENNGYILESIKFEFVENKLEIKVIASNSKD